VRTSLFVSEVVGSIIPMLFTPVPQQGSTKNIFRYFRQRGWHKDLHLLNGKLLPFLHLNDGSISDYVDLQRMISAEHALPGASSFRLFGDTRVSKSLVEMFRNGFEDFLRTLPPRPKMVLRFRKPRARRSCAGVMWVEKWFKH